MDNDSSFRINNVVLEKINNIKCLGFIIDKLFNLKGHSEYIFRKAGKNLCFFKRLRNKVSMLTSISNIMLKLHF